MMTDRRMSRERAKAALKELKKNKRLPKNYPLSAYYRPHLLQEKGERLLADTRRRVSEREEVIAGVDATADDSFGPARALCCAVGCCDDSWCGTIRQYGFLYSKSIIYRISNLYILMV